MNYAIQTFCVTVVLLGCFAVLAWAMKDAASRGKSGVVVALMVISLGGIPGLLVWLACRPPKQFIDPSVPDESAESEYI